jgi:hypothetical protein
LQAVKEHFATLREWERQRAMNLGIKTFKWRFTGGGPFRCSVADRMNGRVFSYASPPNEGMPGACECDHDYCRYCVAISVVPGFE